jgi:hypothetical protein
MAEIGAGQSQAGAEQLILHAGLRVGASHVFLRVF